MRTSVHSLMPRCIDLNLNDFFCGDRLVSNEKDTANSQAPYWLKRPLPVSCDGNPSRLFLASLFLLEVFAALSYTHTFVLYALLAFHRSNKDNGMWDGKWGGWCGVSFIRLLAGWLDGWDDVNRNHQITQWINEIWGDALGLYIHSNIRGYSDRALWNQILT